MVRQRSEKRVYVGTRVEAALAAKFLSLAHGNGVSVMEALRRVMVQAILSNRVPGIDALDLEHREREKWGDATPVYDGEQTPSPKDTTGKVVPAPRAE